MLAVATAAIILAARDGAYGAGVNSITSPYAGPAGLSTSLALDAAGFPVLSFYDSAGQDLKILHCNDANCAGGGESLTSPDAADDVGSFASMKLDAAGFPVVAYLDETNDDLKLLHCNDANCAGGDSITSPDTLNSVGVYPSLALDGAGFPVVSYYDNTNGDLKVLHCNDVNCAGGSESVTSPDTAVSVGLWTSLALDTAGFPVVSYYDSANGDLKLMHCNDANCAAGGESIRSVDTTDDHGQYTSLALDGSGFPVVSYYDASGQDVRVLHCDDANCAGAGESILEPDDAAIVGRWTSLALDASGFPVVSYWDGLAGALRVMRCNDANCAGSNESIALADASGAATGASLKLDASGSPVVSYSIAATLKVLHCGTSTCLGPDTDGDGCTDKAEQQSNPGSQLSGGLRNPNNFWDLFDTPDAANVRDKSIGGTDLFRLLARFGSSGSPAIDPLSMPPAPPAYHTAFDRGATIGPYPWSITAADGAVAGTDFFAILAQFGHTCASGV